MCSDDGRRPDVANVNLLAASLLLILASAFFAPDAALAQEDPDFSEVETEEETDEEELDEVSSRRSSTGLGFEIAVGPLAGVRSMTFSGDEATIDHTPAPYLGGALELALTVLEFGGLDAALVVEAEGTFGSAQNSEEHPAIRRRLVTEHTSGQIQAVFERSMTETVELRGGLGIGATAFTVEPNPTYTGHRYLTGVASMRGLWWFSDDTYRLGAGATFLPGLTTNNSDGAYGEATSFGVKLTADGTWTFYEPAVGNREGVAEATLRYTFMGFQSNFPEVSDVGANATSKERIHMATLLLRYAL